jgi:60 kDa SS-A/Ro ribonucleoprotein
MQKIYANVAVKATQLEQLTPEQIKNNAGGFVYKASDMEVVKRFLILGTEGGSYYVSEQKLTRDMAKACISTIKTDGEAVVALIVEVSDGGRAVKNSPALFLLAASAAEGNLVTRRAALNALPKVARTATHLFEFLEYCKQFRGWGRALKTAVSNWYEQKPATGVAYQAIKYRNRNGWTHRDVLRKAHPKGASEQHVAIYDWLTHGTLNGNLPAIVPVFEQAIRTTSVKEVVSLLQANPSLPWEALSTEVLKSPEVWQELVPNMPLNALVRNLGRMTAINALVPLGDLTALVCKKLTDPVKIGASRIHPLSLFVAARTYGSGAGDRGSLKWDPIGTVTNALEEAFYLAFENVKPTGKRFLLALDVSGSMGMGTCAGIRNLTPREASGLMAMTTLKVEKNCQTMAFSSGFVPLNLTASDNYNSVIKKISDLPFDSTDCSQPMLYAMEKGLSVDCFVIYTDSETWAGRIHPVEALKQYRRKTGINAKLIVVAMEANQFTIADPSDRGMLDVIGFDTSTPQVISEFTNL